MILDFESLVLVAIPATSNLSLVFITPRTPSLRTLDTFSTALVQAQFNYEKEIFLQTDTAGYISAGVLSQYNDQGLIHPVGFFSKKYTPV
jgi:hypothetical protein